MPNRKPHGRLQIHFEFSEDAKRLIRPTQSTLRQIRDTWIDTGKLPPGVGINATFWGERLSTKETRDRLREARDSDALKQGRPGIVSHYWQPNVVLCDYDTPTAPKLTRIYRLAGQLHLRPHWIEYNRTEHGWHVIVWWDRKLSPGETVAIQLLMGSDPKRERFNLARLLSDESDGRNSHRWNLLFSRKL